MPYGHFLRAITDQVVLGGGCTPRQPYIEHRGPSELDMDLDSPALLIGTLECRRLSVPRSRAAGALVP